MSLVTLGNVNQSICVLTLYHHDDDSLLEHNIVIFSILETCEGNVMETFDVVLGGVEFQMVYDPWYGDEHEERSVPTSIHWFLIYILLIGGYPTLLVIEFLYCTWKAAVVWIDGGGWDHYFNLGG